MTIQQIEPAVLFDSNIYLVIGETKTALVDTGTGFGADATVASLKKALGGRKLDYVIITHRHFDHVGGLGRIIKEFSPAVYAGKADADPLIAGDSESTLGTKFGGKIEPMDVKYFDVELDLGGHILSCIDTPGHTIGSICAIDKVTKALFAGDTLFVGGVGNTDHPTGSSAMMIESLKKLSKIKFKGLYPGHGPYITDGGMDQIQKAMKLMGQ